MAVAELDPGWSVGDQGRDELGLATVGGVAECGCAGDFEAAGVEQLAGQRVADGQPAAVEVEPPLAVERQLVGAPCDLAAMTLLQQHGFPGTDPVGGQALPVARQQGLLGVDGDDTIDLDAAQTGFGGEGPDFFTGPRSFACGECEAGDFAGLVGVDRDRPLHQALEHA